MERTSHVGPLPFRLRVRLINNKHSSALSSPFVIEDVLPKKGTLLIASFTQFYLTLMSHYQI